MFPWQTKSILLLIAFFYLQGIRDLRFMMQRYKLFPTRANKKRGTLWRVPLLSKYIAKGNLFLDADFLLLDTGFLTGEITQIEDAGAAHGTVLVDINLLDKRTGEGEDTLHSDAIGDLADSKGFSSSASTALQHNALEVLDSLFVSFLNLVMDSDGIASLEFGELLALDQILYKLH